MEEERSTLDGEPGWSLALQVRVVDGHLIECQCLYCGELWVANKLTFAELGRAFSPAACPHADDDHHGPPRAGFRPYSEPYAG